MAPEGLCRNSTPDALSPVLAYSAGDLFHKLIERFRASSGWKDIEYDQEKHYISAVAETRLLKFKDDVDIRLIAGGTSADADSSCQIAIYSRSRLGYSDLGANQKRVELLLQQITTP